MFSTHFAAGGTGTLNKTDGIKRKQHKVEISEQHISQVVKDQVKMGLPNEQ